MLVRVNFDDAPSACTMDQISSLMWGGVQNVNGFYQEASFNQFTFDPDANGDGQPDMADVTISHSIAESCHYYAWTIAAIQEAQAQGVNLSLYRHRIFVFPRNIDCDWSGLADLGCFDSCDVWTRGCGSGDIFAHELGHNLNLDHAGIDYENDGLVDCEYCDGSCVMGYAGVGWRHFNSVHKDQMGWIAPGQQIVVDTDGNYNMAALELDLGNSSHGAPTTTQILKIPFPESSQWTYYVSYRSPLGQYSTGLATGRRYKTHVHRRWGFSGLSLLVATLGDGQVFDGGSVVVEQIYSEQDYATVHVHVAPSPTPTATRTPTPTATSTSTRTATQTPTVTFTPSPSPTSSATPSATSIWTPSATVTAVPTTIWTLTPTPTPTLIPSQVASPTIGVFRSPLSGRVILKGNWSSVPNPYRKLVVRIQNKSTKSRFREPLDSLGRFRTSIEPGSYKLHTEVRSKFDRVIGVTRSSAVSLVVPYGGGSVALKIAR